MSDVSPWETPVPLFMILFARASARNISHSACLLARLQRYIHRHVSTNADYARNENVKRTGLRGDEAPNSAIFSLVKKWGRMKSTIMREIKIAKSPDDLRSALPSKL